MWSGINPNHHRHPPAPVAELLGGPDPEFPALTPKTHTACLTHCFPLLSPLSPLHSLFSGTLFSRPFCSASFLFQTNSDSLLSFLSVFERKLFLFVAHACPISGCVCACVWARMSAANQKRLTMRQISKSCTCPHSQVLSLCFYCLHCVTMGTFPFMKMCRAKQFSRSIDDPKNCTSTEHGLNREIVLSVLYSAERCKICSVFWCTATEHPRVHWGESWHLQTHQGAVQHAYYSNRLF